MNEASYKLLTGMLDYCGATEKGSRENNEDACIAIALKERKLFLFAVADGLGGQAAGEVASALAVTELRETVKKGTAALDIISKETMKYLLAKGFRKANEEVLYQGTLVPERYGMGTTLVAALLDDEGRGIVANVGDSRAYLIGKNIIRITRDHSYVQELVDEGIISEEQAFRHPDKNIVTRIIGMEGADPDFYDVELNNDALLLCSDGLTDAMRDREIMEVFSRHGSLDHKCTELVDAALSRGARDNVTVVLAWKRGESSFKSS